VDRILTRPEDELFAISDPFDYDLPAAARPTFELLTCSNCGEAVAANRAHIKNGATVCHPCSGYADL